MTASSDRGRLDLSGARALVTGANQGIGGATAIRLAEHGARVAVNYPDRARRPTDLHVLGPEAIAIEADVGRCEAIDALFAELDEAFGARAAARRMVAGGAGGTIVNIASDSAFTPSIHGAHDCASKAGLVALIKSLALALAPHRVRVNAVALGLTDTAQPRGGYSEAELDAAAGRLPPTPRSSRRERSRSGTPTGWPLYVGPRYREPEGR